VAERRHGENEDRKRKEEKACNDCEEKAWLLRGSAHLMAEMQCLKRNYICIISVYVMLSVHDGLLRRAPVSPSIPGTCVT
jgi:hypothetical protein